MPTSGPHRPSPHDRWLLVTDVDDTLIGDDAALRELLPALRAAMIPIALNSSRPATSVRSTLDAHWPEDAAPPDAVITALGTEIDYASGGHDRGWQAGFEDWPRNEVDRVVRGLGFEAHASEFQTQFKASYAVPAGEAARVETALDAAGIERRTIHSGDSDFDVIPRNAGKAAAMFRVATCLEVPADYVIVAGDSGNDLVMFDHASKGIVVGNARPELRERVDRERAYFASAARAGGILEALRHWQLIPERSDP